MGEASQLVHVAEGCVLLLRGVTQPTLVGPVVTATRLRAEAVHRDGKCIWLPRYTLPTQSPSALATVQQRTNDSTRPRPNLFTQYTPGHVSKACGFFSRVSGRFNVCKSCRYPRSVPDHVPCITGEGNSVVAVHRSPTTPSIA
jgi:hypothetical protein